MLNTSNEILVRPIEKEDFVGLFVVVEKNRDRLIHYFPHTIDSIGTMDSARRFTRFKIRQASDKEQFAFVMVVKGTSEIIGMVLLKNLDWTIPKGELSYFVDMEYERLGVTSYAVKWVIGHAFNHLGLQKLYIKVDPDNEASKRVALKNNFEKEGLLKKEFRTGKGKLCDVERYGLLKDSLFRSDLQPV